MSWWDLKRYADRDLNEGQKEDQARDLEKTVRFILTAARGYAFMHRNPAMFVAYSVAFRSGPVHVLLDATANVSGLSTMMPGAKSGDVPRTDYRHLQTFHIEQLKAFKWVTKVVETKEAAEPYAEWIKATILPNTQPGEEVLIVVHNGLLKHGYIPKSENPAEP